MRPAYDLAAIAREPSVRGRFVARLIDSPQPYAREALRPACERWTDAGTWSCSMRIEGLRIHGFGRLVEREFELGPGLVIGARAKRQEHHAQRADRIAGRPGARRPPQSLTRPPSLSATVRGPDHRYGSRLDLVSAAGRRLRLDWDFGRWVFTVTDAATGEDVSSAFLGAGTDPEVLCRELYGVSRDAYLAVASVRQGELDAIGDSADVRQALERVAGQSGEAEGAAGAMAALRAGRARLVGLNRSRTNPLPQAEHDVEQLTASVQAAERERSEAEGAAAERDRLTAQATELEQRRLELEMAHAAATARRLRARVERATALDGECRQATAMIDGEADGWTPVDGVAGARERARDLERRAATATPELNEARRRLASLEARPQPAPPARSRPLGRAAVVVVAGLAAVALGIATGRPAAVALGVLVAAAGVAVGAIYDGSHAEARHRQALDHHARAARERDAETARLRTELARPSRGRRAAGPGPVGSLLGVEAKPELIASALAEYDEHADHNVQRQQAAHRREVAQAELRSLLGRRRAWPS